MEGVMGASSRSHIVDPQSKFPGNHLTAHQVEMRLPLVARIADELIEAWSLRHCLNANTADSDLDQRLLLEELDEELSSLKIEIEQLGGQLRDPSTGAIEFPAQIEGIHVLLSWRRGETKVTHYRYPDALDREPLALA